jgi:hypothetical protein
MLIRELIDTFQFHDQLPFYDQVREILSPQPAFIDDGKRALPFHMSAAKFKF